MICEYSCFNTTVQDLWKRVIATEYRGYTSFCEILGKRAGYKCARSEYISKSG